MLRDKWDIWDILIVTVLPAVTIGIIYVAVHFLTPFW